MSDPTRHCGTVRQHGVKQERRKGFDESFVEWRMHFSIHFSILSHLIDSISHLGVKNNCAVERFSCRVSFFFSVYLYWKSL